MNIDRCNAFNSSEVSSPAEMLPVELVEKVLTIANNPTARAVNRTFRDAQRTVDEETIKQYLQQPCINRFVSHEFATLPHDLMNPDAHRSRHQMIQRINHAIIAPMLIRHPLTLILSSTTVFPAEQLNEYAESILDYNLQRILHELFFGEFNQSERDNLDPDSMEGLKEKLKTLPTTTEQASAIRSWMEENRETLAQITGLTLSDIGLTYIPPELSIYFPNLRILNLSDNQLKNLPEGFGSTWTNLQVLCLNNNQLEVLPEGFGFSWANLSWLLLNDNQLKVLPEGFSSSWTNLNKMTLDNNQLKTLPKGFGSFCASLEILFLDSNQLEALPKGFGSPWTNLRELDLSENRLNTLPEDFGSPWTNLERLGLDNNQLEALPKGFGSSWTNLKILYLDDNQLAALPEDFGFSWMNLRELTLSKNQLNTLPENFGSTWANLQRLTWYNDQLDMSTLSDRLLNMLSLYLLKGIIVFFENHSSKEEQLETIENMKKVFNKILPQPLLDSIDYEVCAATEPFFPQNDPNFGRHAMWENLPCLCAALQKVIHKNTPQRPLDNAIQAIRYYASLRSGRLQPAPLFHDSSSQKYSNYEQALREYENYQRTITEHVRLALADLDVDTRNTIYTEVWESRENSNHLQQLDETDPNFGENNVAADLDLLCDILKEIRKSLDE